MEGSRVDLRPALDDGDYLASAGLPCTIEVGTVAEGGRWATTATWVGFLIWAGWWLRRYSAPNHRIVMMLSVAARPCCSPLIALGSVLESLAATERVRISWEEVLRLPHDTEIHLLRDVKGAASGKVRARGKLAEIRSLQDQVVREVILEEPAKFAGAKQLLFPRNLDAVRPSLVPYVVTGRPTDTLDLSRALEHLCPGFPQAWLFSRELEALIVTERSSWARHLDDLQLKVTPRDRSQEVRHTKLSDILFVSSTSVQSSVRTAVMPPTSIGQSTGAPLAILDGPRSIEVWESIEAPRLVFLLEACELDDLILPKLRRIASFGDRELPGQHGPLPRATPPGIEMTVFSLRSA